MKTKIRICSIFLSMLIIVTALVLLLPAKVSAKNIQDSNVADPCIELHFDNAEVLAGEKVDVNITLKNNPGIASIVFGLYFDEEILTLKGVEYNTEIGGQTVPPASLESGSKLYWVNGFEDFDKDALFATLTFEVSENAKAGDVTYINIEYSPDDVYNISEVNIYMNPTGGKISVIKCVPGDINGDGVLNNKDVTRFMQYNAGWDVEVNAATLDVNGDGSVNNKDVTRLMQYIAGWDVEIY